MPIKLCRFKMRLSLRINLIKIGGRTQFLYRTVNLQLCNTVKNYHSTAIQVIKCQKTRIGTSIRPSYSMHRRPLAISYKHKEVASHLN